MPAQVPSKKRADQVYGQLSDGARELLKGADNPRGYWERLVDKGFYADAVHFMARWLTRPQAIWWACLCIRHSTDRQANAAEQAAWKAIVYWLQEPSEENRRLLEIVSKPLTLKNPIGAVAHAAFWSAGSMASKGGPEVLPPEDLTAEVIAAAVTSLHGNLYPQFMQFAREVAGGANSWTA